MKIRLETGVSAFLSVLIKPEGGELPQAAPEADVAEETKEEKEEAQEEVSA